MNQNTTFAMNSEPATAYYVHPLHARSYYRSKTPLNFRAFIITFAVAEFIVRIVFPPRIGILVCIAFIFFGLSKILATQVTGIRCLQCNNFIDTRVRWQCGFCSRINVNFHDFPFIHKCEYCHVEPNAYKCHHCGQLVFLSFDRRENAYAESYVEKFRRYSQSEAKRILALEEKTYNQNLTIEQLNRKIERIKKRPNVPKKSRAYRVKEKSLEQHHLSVMATREIAWERKRTIAEQYKDDPDRLQAATDAVDDWLRSQT